VGFGGDGEHAGTFPLHVKSQVADLGLHAVEVVAAQRVELVEFRGPTGAAVLGAVGEAGLDETPVAARGGPTHPVGVDDDDPGAGIAARGVQGGPQTGVAGTDDEQVASGRAGHAG
jgi:hypothetical protein